MLNTSNPSEKERPKRIGILLGDLHRLNLPALKYLVLNMNCLQQAFQYEFFNCDTEDKWLRLLGSRHEIERKSVKIKIPAFLKRLDSYLRDTIAASETQEPPPTYFILLSMAKFNDGYYTT
jgi:hypothetical protein